jgi:hypothetical protein
MLLAFDYVYPELPQLNELRSGFVGFIFLDFFNFLVAFFDAMDFLLHSNCPPGGRRNIGKSEAECPGKGNRNLSSFGMRAIQWQIPWARPEWAGANTE